MLQAEGTSEIAVSKQAGSKLFSTHLTAAPILKYLKTPFSALYQEANLEGTDGNLYRGRVEKVLNI